MAILTNWPRRHATGGFDWRPFISNWSKIAQTLILSFINVNWPLNSVSSVTTVVVSAKTDRDASLGLSPCSDWLGWGYFLVAYTHPFLTPLEGGGMPWTPPPPPPTLQPLVLPPSPQHCLNLSRPYRKKLTISKIPKSPIFWKHFSNQSDTVIMLRTRQPYVK